MKDVAFNYRLLGCVAAAAWLASAIASSAEPAAAPLKNVVWATQMNGTFNLDPDRISNPVAQAIIGAAYDTLYRFVGPDLTTLQPDLATSYTVSDDLKTYTIKLRTDVKFADGSPLTSADVVWSFLRMKNLLGAASTFTTGLSMSAPDPDTVVVTSDEPNSGLLVTLTTYNFGILNSKLLEKNGGSAEVGANTTDKTTGFFLNSSAGSGPYEVKSFVATNRAVLVPNPNYWGPQKAAFEQIVIVNTPSQQQLPNVQAGVAQIAIELSNTQVEGLDLGQTSRVPAGLQLNQSPGIRQFFLTFNMQPVDPKSPTANVNFRQAVRYALNYDVIGRIAGKGAAISTGFIPVIVPGSLPESDAPKQDLSKARDFLAKSGLVNPTVTLTYPTDTPLNGILHADFAQQVQADLAKVGITVELQGLPNATAFPQHATGRTEMALFTYSRPPDVSAYARAYCPGPQPASGSQQSLPYGWIRWVQGTDPETDKLCTQAIGAVGQDKIAAGQQLGRRLDDVGPYLGLFEPSVNVLADRRLTGAVGSPAYSLDLRELRQHQ